MPAAGAWNRECAAGARNGQPRWPRGLSRARLCIRRTDQPSTFSCVAYVGPACASGAQISHWKLPHGCYVRSMHKAARQPLGGKRPWPIRAPGAHDRHGGMAAIGVLGRYVRPVHTTAPAAWPQSGCLAETCARCTPRHPRARPPRPRHNGDQRRRADSTGADRTGVPWNDAATKHRVVSSRRRVSVRRRSFRETAQSRAGLSGSPPPVREPCRFRHGSLSLCRAPAPAP
jgi:hypothetical protein